MGELIGLLREAGADLLIDVRSFPRSRANPQFTIEALPAALAAAGVGYRHVKDLGGRRGSIPGPRFCRILPLRTRL